MVVAREEAVEAAEKANDYAVVTVLLLLAAGAGAAWRAVRGSSMQPEVACRGVWGGAAEGTRQCT